MKTKFKFNTASFTLDTHKAITRDMNGQVLEATAVPVEIPAIDVECEVEYTASEMLELWKVTKTIMAESPEVIGEFMVKMQQVVTQANAMTEEGTNESC